MTYINVLDKTKDSVIDSDYLTIKIDYKYAIEKLFPLINRLDFQRNSLNKKYYKRLKQDIIDGCVLPPLTIAFDDEKLKELIGNENIEFQEISELLDTNIDKGFILDGIQRLSVLKEASEEDGFELNTSLYANVILSNSINKLLYRMIILNNGQRPMSARHQIEILMNRTIDHIATDEKYQQFIYSEKHSVRGDGKSKLKKEILVKSYLAYSTKSISIDNQKIIESKLNEIISDKIVSSEVKNSEIEFNIIFNFLIEKIENNKFGYHKIDLIEWLNNENNSIGLFVGVANNNDFLNIDYAELMQIIEIIEEFIENINPSKVKVSSVRRTVVSDVVKNYKKFLEDEDYRNDYILGI
ncbi:hypothetical protein [Exiguobacterium sp. E4787]|uniref:hypothetical protein n=1 Tax=Exiguobacterium sp. E4787 TaxID=2751225 RepID=UPI001BEC36DE|nr:hypothetical protein [Exiguobacterium sp. E4787]